MATAKVFSAHPKPGYHATGRGGISRPIAGPHAPKHASTKVARKSSEGGADKLRMRSGMGTKPVKGSY